MKAKQVSGWGQGFTLIELLVVIAIISLLAAILFPVFARARENARRASCQSNQKQIGLGILQYSQDYDEYYVARYLSGAGNTPQAITGWANVIQPYLKSTQILQCPSEKTRGSDIYSSTSFTDYAMPDTLGSNVDSGVGSRVAITPAKASAFTSTASSVLIFEYKTNNAAIGDRYGDSTTGYFKEAITNPTADVNVYAAARRHLDGSNFLFADGHVKWSRPEKITNDDPTTGNPTFRVN
jgi:prepilin-type N-terminal cleavage/methylation domain-containing protein/prepilin-type processing-associated H-X9-DG protein